MNIRRRVARRVDFPKSIQEGTARPALTAVGDFERRNRAKRMKPRDIYKTEPRGEEASESYESPFSRANRESIVLFFRLRQRRRGRLVRGREFSSCGSSVENRARAGPIA